MGSSSSSKSIGKSPSAAQGTTGAGSSKGTRYWSFQKGAWRCYYRWDWMHWLDKVFADEKSTFGHIWTAADPMLRVWMIMVDMNIKGGRFFFAASPFFFECFSPVVLVSVVADWLKNVVNPWIILWHQFFNQNPHQEVNLWIGEMV